MILGLSFFVCSATAREMGPILPRYMVKIIISFPAMLNKGVRFLESPTVAVALTVSYKISSMLASVTRESSIVEINIILKNIPITATALLMERRDILRLKRVTSFLSFMVDMTNTINTVKVTVLIPPAVPTGEPPINISKRDKSEVAFVRFC